MTKVRTLAPLTHPTTGELFAAGAEVDVADDVAADWRADGKVSLVDDEKKEHIEAGQAGEYRARTGRADVGHQEAEEPKDAKDASAKKK